MCLSLAGVYAIPLIIVFMLAGKATSKYCDGGHFCSPPKECCTKGCCYIYAPPGYRPPVAGAPNVFNLVFWDNWYFWSLLLIFISCIGGCGVWRRRRDFSSCFRCFCYCCRGNHHHNNCDDEPNSERDSAGSCYPPPQYSRCSSFHHAPPPYAEVTSKPDLYPLVISYENGKGNSGGSYLMVQYFRNYIMRPTGSLSNGSTEDSLNSSFLCNAANEANTVVPPPYSATGSLEGFATSSPPQDVTPLAPPPSTMVRSVSSLASFNNTCPNNQTTDAATHSIADTITNQQSFPSRSPSCLSGDLQSLCLSRPPLSLLLQNQHSFVSATALSTTGSDISSLAGLGTPSSPPRATSPTLEIRELLDKIQQLPYQEENVNSPLLDGCPDSSMSQQINMNNSNRGRIVTNTNGRTKLFRHCGSGRNLYMQLGTNTNTFGSRNKPRHWMSHSAPSTPSTQLPPLTFNSVLTRPSSSNRRSMAVGTEDGSPLLTENCTDEERDAED